MKTVDSLFSIFGVAMFFAVAGANSYVAFSGTTYTWGMLVASLFWLVIGFILFKQGVDKL